MNPENQQEQQQQQDESPVPATLGSTAIGEAYTPLQNNHQPTQSQPDNSQPEYPQQPAAPEGPLPYKKDQRINNVTFIVAWAILSLVPVAIYIVMIVLLFPSLLLHGSKTASNAISVVSMLVTLGLIIYTLMLHVRIAAYRFWDMGKSSAFVLLYILPVIGFGMLIWMFIAKSQPAPNKHGPVPLGPVTLHKIFKTAKVQF